MELHQHEDNDEAPSKQLVYNQPPYIFATSILPPSFCHLALLQPYDPQPGCHLSFSRARQVSSRRRTALRWKWGQNEGERRGEGRKRRELRVTSGNQRVEKFPGNYRELMGLVRDSMALQ